MLVSGVPIGPSHAHAVPVTSVEDCLPSQTIPCLLGEYVYHFLITLPTQIWFSRVLISVCPGLEIHRCVVRVAATNCYPPKMRIFLLPISTRRTLIYCEKQPPSSKTSYADWAINKASSTWADLEKAPKGWKKSLVNLGNGIFRRIPFEEWGLKTLPSYSKSTIETAAMTRVLFPGRFLEEGKVTGLLARIATERQKLHKQRLVWSIVGMPLTIPVAILPVIPNIPLFYLAFRAWSHYKGSSSGR